MNLTEYIDSKHDEHLNELYEFLRIPSVSAQSEHKPDIERAAIEMALKETRGNRRRAAEMLGIGERTLYRKIKEYRMPEELYTADSLD